MERLTVGWLGNLCRLTTGSLAAMQRGRIAVKCTPWLAPHLLQKLLLSKMLLNDHPPRSLEHIPKVLWIS